MLAHAPAAAARAPAAHPPAAVLFDLTRLISRARHPTPTGIDRVDLAYARALLAERQRSIGFVADVAGLGQRRFSRSAVARFVEVTAARWASAGEALPAGLRTNPALGLLGGLGVRAGLPANAIELVVAHQRLDRPNRLQRRLARNGTRLVAFIHDAIPCEFPEYARAESAERHRVRLVTAARLARGLIVNSEATAAALAPWLAGNSNQQLLVAPLGIEARPAVPEPAARPYFVCLGTIEPRKNHLLLLNVWRRLAETRPAAEVPRLVIIGRRGWENENILDMLERCPALKGVVEELSGVSDQRLAGLVAGARAVLMPSFAEGFGLPVGEALAQGTPVLASDLPALRETGGAVPEYLDPIDGPAWATAILDYARPGSHRRQQQLDRLHHWSPPRWDDHFERVLAFLDRLPA